ncbi:MAG: type II toxin-antitoxin system VapC family toxin [Pseudomonadota bacterium]
MLDTDTCSYLMRARDAKVLAAMEARVEAGHHICISVISYSELRLGAARSQAKTRYDRLIDALVDRLDFVAEWTVNEADRFADVQAALMGQGASIGSNDAMIASHALAIDAVLVTNNLRHFSRVDGLQVENWRED